jgi:hypothetical protein
MTHKTLDILRMFAEPANTGARYRYRESLERTYHPMVWQRKIESLERKGYIVNDGRNGGVLTAKGRAALEASGETP